MKSKMFADMSAVLDSYGTSPPTKRRSRTKEEKWERMEAAKEKKSRKRTRRISNEHRYQSED